MTVGELLKELAKQKRDAKVLFEWEEMPRCSCSANDLRCYCSEETHQAIVNTCDPFEKTVVIRGAKIAYKSPAPK